MLVEQCFESVLQQYTPLIKGQIRKLHLAQDFDEYFQIGAIALWDAYRRFDEEKGSFSTYAYYTVRGQMLRALQKQRTFTEQHLLQDEQTSKLFEFLTSDSESDPIEFDFSLLSERERLWVHETFINGKKRQEIADEQAVSVYTVSSWRKSALKKLRELER